MCTLLNLAEGALSLGLAYRHTKQQKSASNRNMKAKCLAQDHSNLRVRKKIKGTNPVSDSLWFVSFAHESQSHGNEIFELKNTMKLWETTCKALRYQGTFEMYLPTVKFPICLCSSFFFSAVASLGLSATSSLGPSAGAPSALVAVAAASLGTIDAVSGTAAFAAPGVYLGLVCVIIG